MLAVGFIVFFFRCSSSFPCLSYASLMLLRYGWHYVFAFIFIFLHSHFDTDSIDIGLTAEIGFDIAITFDVYITRWAFTNSHPQFHVFPAFIYYSFSNACNDVPLHCRKWPIFHFISSVNLLMKCARGGGGGGGRKWNRRMIILCFPFWQFLSFLFIIMNLA